MSKGQRTKDEIGRVAALQFAAHGFAGASVREIAREAGVDAALVMRYFTSKERLFLETMRGSEILHRLLDVPLANVGEAVCRAFIGGASDSDRSGELGVFAALIRASDRDGVRDRLRRSVEAGFGEALASRMTGPDIDLRISLIAAQAYGLLCSLQLVADPVLLDPARKQAAIELYGPSIQRLIDGPDGGAADKP